MGYRIELAEIETNLNVHPQVKDAIVLLCEAEGGLTELVAFFEANENLDSTNLSGFLESKIPRYMIPKRFIQLETLPRNDRGKIARDGILKLYSKMDKGIHGEA
jgi:acyl-coenzyme A synthetase/AMP-(fatty) acid ligase